MQKLIIKNFVFKKEKTTFAVQKIKLIFLNNNFLN